MAEIELQPLSMEDHSAPVLPARRVTTQSSTSHQFTNQSTAYNIECNSQNFVLEIEPQPQEIQDRPAPALPSYNRFTAHQSTTQSSTTHPSATHSSPTQFLQARDSEEYLIPMPERTESATSIYSYVYEHMVARIMAFVSLQRRGGLVTTRAEIHHPHQRPRRTRRPMSDPMSRFWNTRSSSIPDVSNPTQEANQVFRETPSEPAGNNTQSNNPVYERIDDNREIVMMHPAGTS